jgi:hypothetical protein
VEVAMIESEWLSCKDPGAMLEFLRGKVSDRKLRLFACACCRNPDWMLLDRDEAAISSIEYHADKWAGVRSFHPANFGGLRSGAIWAAAESAYDAANEWVMSFGPKRGKKWKPAQAALFRDIFGNPFKPIAFDPAWRTSTVVEVAKAIYEERAFERMPVLGDALEEAGCSSPEILNHCRAEGVHVRGCFVVDGVLGKE